jgi:GMP synthase (glutamine-hydrolysing)
LSTQKVVILDFGAQYTQLIARRVRELNVYSVVFPFDADFSSVQAEKPIALILSGGPNSVYAPGAPQLDRRYLDLGIPVLGICYGMQQIVRLLGGTVEQGERGGEYGNTAVRFETTEPIFAGIPDESIVWMSHGDHAAALPEGFRAVAGSEGCPHAAVISGDGRIVGLQFHPEVTHTEQGRVILRNFLFGTCGAVGDWKMSSFIDNTVASLRRKLAGERVLLGLSGGVDSSVTALLLQKAIGDDLDCIFVDNCFLRKGEAEEVASTFRDHFRIRLHSVDASEVFLEAIRDVDDPEEKRRRIGHTFIRIFREKAAELKGIGYLAQGTLYPDVIESVAAHGGPTATIKTHHNVGGLPEELGFKLVEPLRSLFKDEVREIGRLMGLPSSMVGRHPFPGPGLAVRVPGRVTREDLEILREADAVLIEELRNAGMYDRTSQVFAVLLPVYSVGVMGDERTYARVVALRAVVTEDFMTADWARLPYDLLARISNRIINEVRGVNRVVYDISSKPPSTIEWE